MVKCKNEGFGTCQKAICVTRTSASKSKKQREMKQTRNWLDLESDVMANILSRVGVIEILWNVQIVCPEWHKICKDLGSEATVEICKQAVDRSQGQLIDITLVDFCDDEILQYIADRGLATAFKKLPLLEELSLYQGTLLQEDIEALGCYCPMLKTLKLNSPNRSNLEGYELAMAIVKNLPELRHLELTKHALEDSWLRAILDGCRHLQVLDLRMCEPDLLKGELRDFGWESDDNSTEDHIPKESD
ncbi:RNI-like superfamily protein [Artemisia annua]|uniref:RNI-like superfamily protein n=1 Tax=Artemisia annua TaxID=35608 RepID=A0A2U1PF34_ARTAN|nr:RNI-like superfamily protein [Artemisia annua]